MGIHWTELVVVAFVALLIFGPKRLPEIGGAVGRTYREFRKSLGEVAELATSELASSEPQQLPATFPRGLDGADRNVRDAGSSRS